MRKKKERNLIWIEAVDPIYTKELGWSTEVDRVLLYTSEMKENIGLSIRRKHTRAFQD